MNANVFLLSSTLGFIVMLVTYPFWNPVNNRKVSFKRWALVALVANVTAFFIAVVIGNWILQNG